LKLVFERVQGIERLIVEVLLAKFVPQMLDRIELRSVGG
jgi:hypothetical protein